MLPAFRLPSSACTPIEAWMHSLRAPSRFCTTLPRVGLRTDPLSETAPPEAAPACETKPRAGSLLCSRCHFRDGSAPHSILPMEPLIFGRMAVVRPPPGNPHPHRPRSAAIATWLASLLELSLLRGAQVHRVTYGYSAVESLSSGRAVTGTGPTPYAWSLPQGIFELCTRWYCEPTPRCVSHILRS